MNIENMKKQIKRAFEADEISLCKNCYCMTHTIDGKCGKCGVIKEVK